MYWLENGVVRHLSNLTAKGCWGRAIHAKKVLGESMTPAHQRTCCDNIYIMVKPRKHFDGLASRSWIINEYRNSHIHTNWQKNMLENYFILCFDQLSYIYIKLKIKNGLSKLKFFDNQQKNHISSSSIFYFH